MSQNDPWDDWEQADDAGIEVPSLPAMPSKPVAAPIQPIKILQRPSGKELAAREAADTKALQDKNKALWNRANAFQTPVIERTDTTRTEYVPEINILRRPKGPSTVAAPRPSPVMKPLAEREAEYRAAREKIFGPSSSTTPSLPSSSPSSSPSRTPPIEGHPTERSSSPQEYGKTIHFSGEQPSFRLRPTHVMDTAMRQPRGPPSPGPGSSSSPSSRGRAGFGHGGRGGSRTAAPSSASTEPGMPSPESGGSRGFHRPPRGRPHGSPSSFTV